MSTKPDTPNFDSINPAVCVNAKLRKLHRLLNSAYQQKINAFGLRGSMLSILFIIGKKKDLNQKAIAEMLVLDQSTMSRDLKKLVSKGYVLVNKGGDGRNSLLELSVEGYLLLEEIVPVWLKLQTEVELILGQFNVQQIDQLTAAIQTNLDRLRE